MSEPPRADTIVALSSGRPPAAIAIVRTSGPSSFSAAEAITGALPATRQAMLRRLKDPADGTLIDEALILRFDAPNSSTGENIVEYQCHGGQATIDALISVLLKQPGVRLAEPGEFTRRALANGRIDLTEAEELLALSARAEVAIVYADEEEGAVESNLAPALRQLATAIGQLIDAPRVEPLRDGIRVVVAGPPNAGKSSLVNALAQSEKAIVTHVAGTTRDVIEVPISIDGIPFVLVDTAGLRESQDIVESIGIDRARSEADRADILLWLGPPAEAPEHAGLVRIAAKADLGRSGDGLAISSVTGEGLAELMRALMAQAKEQLPKGDELALDRRQHDLLADAYKALDRASNHHDPVLVAEELRIARLAIDKISGRAGVEDLLDALFGRFCLGK